MKQASCKITGRQRKAMSILEVTFACVLITAMAVIALAFARQPGDRVKTNACDLNVARLETLAQQYRLDYGNMPSGSMVELSQARYLGHSILLCPVDGRTYALDRSTGEIIPHSH